MLKLIFLRMARERRLFAILLLSMCLVTGFLALGPLYVQALSISDFDVRINNAPASTFSVIVRNEQALDGQVPQIIEQNLTTYISDQRSYRAIGDFVCGFFFDDGATINPNARTNGFECYRPYAYDDISQIFTVAQGRFPQETNTDIVEAVITVATAESKGYGIGKRFIVGGNPDDAVIVEVVGLVQPILPPRATFWEPQSILDTTTTFFTPTDSREDISFAVTVDDFENRLVSAGGTPGYFQQFDLLPDTFDALALDSVTMALQATNDELTLVHPDIAMTTRFDNLVQQFRSGIERAQGPVTIISFLVLVLMIYNIVATASLILEQQAEEWSMMASRGGSVFQLVYIQFQTTLILGVIAGLAGPLVAYLIMLILASAGPYAAIISASAIGSIPEFSLVMSLIAALIIIVVLTIPAWAFASRSLTQLKSSAVRAPQAPVWARYFLDIAILIAGFVFLARLFWLSTDENLLPVFSNPAILNDILSGDSATILFADAFNLAGPVLLLLGASMLWLRIFPLLIRIVGGIVAQGDGLTTRLAFWNVERDPGHYAQLVLLLIGTLALGTSSLALTATRTIGGWAAVRAEIGADVSLSIDPALYDASIAWDDFPGVIDAVPVMRVSASANDDTALVALELENISSEEFEAVADPFTRLSETTIELPGLQLPPDVASLELDVYARAPEDDSTIDTLLAVTLEDFMGVKSTLELTADDPTAFERFQTYRVDIPDFGVRPYRMVRLELRSQHSNLDEFEHVIYLDNMVAISASGDRVLANAFEPDTYKQWQWNSGSRFTQALETTSLSNDSEIVAEGTTSLRIRHALRPGSIAGTTSPVLMNYNNRPLPPIPVVVSQSFANVQGQSSRFRRPLQIGDSLSVSLNFTTGNRGDARESFSYEIVGIIEGDYPSFPNRERLIFADYELLRYRLNTYSFTSQNIGLVYDYNTVWFEIEGREPLPEFISDIENLESFESVQYARDRFGELLSDPLTNAVTGLLFAGFWVSLLLSLMDFGFYMAITIRRRALPFATLQAIGWDERNLLNLLLVEQAIFILPAIVIGIIFGILLATIILPFLSLVGALQLQIPYLSIIGLVTVLIILSGLILRVTAVILRRLSLNQVMRFGE